ncbi:DUF4105 domain-containing protein [Luteimonas kalidii]|uniref:DUF4105 domain-containing protein n=1 Tax=Luteimonas kalidii TaxID=3042025 RepID=A0ABT6JW80_9GAMM|nr:DUF4105 domain-containing protein [Luteimonas kalidii]MDH5834201.1 DUF4105 domain-containing protein [Luteimonas kalidii]
MRWLAVRACGLVALLGVALPAAAALRLTVDPQGLTPTEADATRALADAALARLPPAFVARLDRNVGLHWRDDLPEHVHGRARGGDIALRRALLDGWVARDPHATSADPGAHAALSALLHELAHVHARSGAGDLARDPRLLDLAGWPVVPLRFGLRTPRNSLRERSPDPYEYASPSEFVAVNFEHFLLDPDYACRRPAVDRLLRAHFGAPPMASSECAATVPLVASGDDGAALRLESLDPSRVHAVDYLLAEPDERAMSRWGHSMLRLVVCAPGRPPGPDCRLDLSHHLVLSFRAFVDDVQVSNWRGLTGAYPARLFILPLSQVLDEYTRVELRGLRSVPLRLGEDEISGLLERAAQVHWSYDGRYRFVTNNCAVETWKLLNDGVPRLAGADLRSITPTGLLRRLERDGVADASVLADPAAALRLGYRFESLETYFTDMFAIATAAHALPAGDVQAWFALDPGERRPWLARGDLRTTAALLVLERAALRRDEAQAREMLKQRFLRGEDAGSDEAGRSGASDLDDAREERDDIEADPDPVDGRATAGDAAGDPLLVPVTTPVRDGADPAGTLRRLRELLEDGAYAGRPALLLPGAGYGLPQAEERARLSDAVVRDDARLRRLREDLMREARTWLPSGQRHRLDAAESNLALLGARLRELGGARSVSSR